MPREASPAETVAAIEARADRAETPCHEGRMVWRLWGEGPPVVLLHGSFGSWTHWIRNIEPLARRFRVVVPDLPGLGHSDLPLMPYTADGLAEILHDGLDIVLGPTQPLAICGFSFGGIISGPLAVRLGPRLRHLVLVAANGMALPRPRPEDGSLKRLRAGMRDAEIDAVHRHNLGRMMIAAPARIDALAVHLQRQNAARARIRPGEIPDSDTLSRALPEIRARLGGIWGSADQMAAPHLAEREAVLRRHHPELDFQVIAGAGHWVAYEAADAVNAALDDMLAGSAGT